MTQKYDITKYLKKGTVNFLAKDLNTWYEIEELMVESWEESGKNEDAWRKLTGFEDYVRNTHFNVADGRNDRTFGCFLYGEVEPAIKNLGGKLYKDRINDNDKEREREREREQNCCLQCQNKPIQKNLVHFCSDSCVNKWLQKNVNSFHKIGTDGTNEKGTNCKNCRQKIASDNIDDDAEFLKVVEHVIKCNENKEIATCKNCGKYPVENDHKVSCVCGWKKSGCDECQNQVNKELEKHSKTCDKSNNIKNKGERIKKLFEKIFEKCPELKNDWGWYFQDGRMPNEKDNGHEWKWCVGTPIWLKKVDKQEAEELKSLLQGISFGYGGTCPYQNWLPSDQEISSKGKIDQSKFKNVAIRDKNGTGWSINLELIKELDKIIENKENDKGNNNQPVFSNKKQLQEFLPALIQLQQFIIANNIHSITNQNGKLVIIFNQNQTNPNSPPPPQTITDEELSETSTLMESEQKSMWKKFKDYLKKTKKDKIDKQQLEREINNLKSNNQEQNPTSKTPLIIGGIVMGVILIGGLISILRNNKKSKK